MQTPHILIVEDELVTRNTLKVFSKQKVTMYLKRPMARKCIRSCLKMISTSVIMDINLPGKNGLLLARELREQADVALMFLTGRDNEVDKILGLEIGADDYITKPFNPRELTIRARNLLSRTMNLGTVSEERRSVESYSSTAGNSISTAVPRLARTANSTSCRAVNSARCCTSAKTRAKFSLVPNC